MSAILLLIIVLAAGHNEAIEPCTRRLDLALVLDGSSTLCGGTQVCPKWNEFIQFCKDIVNSLTIGPSDSRVAFVTVSDVVEMKWNLNGYTDKTSLLSAIDNVKYKGGELLYLLSAGILFTDIFNREFGDKPNVHNVIIWVTNGIPLIDEGKAAAMSNAFQKIGIKVYLVCITPGCTESMAISEASPPKEANVNYFLVDYNLSIDSIRENLMKQICTI